MPPSHRPSSRAFVEKVCAARRERTRKGTSPERDHSNPSRAPRDTRCGRTEFASLRAGRASRCASRSQGDDRTGGPGAEPHGSLDAWLVTDERAELIPAIRPLAAARDSGPRAAGFERNGLAHRDAPPWSTRIIRPAATGSGRRGTASSGLPSSTSFPDGRVAPTSCSRGRPHGTIRSDWPGGVGGHMDVGVAREARRLGVKRLVFAHIGRPALRALARGERLPFGEVAADRQGFPVARRRTSRREPPTRPSRSVELPRHLEILNAQRHCVHGECRTASPEDQPPRGGGKDNHDKE